MLPSGLTTVAMSRWSKLPSAFRLKKKPNSRMRLSVSSGRGAAKVKEGSGGKRRAYFLSLSGVSLRGSKERERTAKESPYLFLASSTAFLNSEVMVGQTSGHDV